MIRYFLKTDGKGKATAVIRLTIDNEKKIILDQFWNPTTNTWQNGFYGMEEIAFGLPDVIEGDKGFIYKYFPECPLDKGFEELE